MGSHRCVQWYYVDLHPAGGIHQQQRGAARIGISALHGKPHTGIRQGIRYFNHYRYNFVVDRFSALNCTQAVPKLVSIVSDKVENESAAKPPIVDLRNVSKWFDGSHNAERIVALEDLSLLSLTSWAESSWCARPIGLRQEHYT